MSNRIDGAPARVREVDDRDNALTALQLYAGGHPWCRISQDSKGRLSMQVERNISGQPLHISAGYLEQTLSTVRRAFGKS